MADPLMKMMMKMMYNYYYDASIGGHSIFCWSQAFQKIQFLIYTYVVYNSCIYYTCVCVASCPVVLDPWGGGNERVGITSGSLWTRYMGPSDSLWGYIEITLTAIILWSYWHYYKDTFDNEANFPHEQILVWWYICFFTKKKISTEGVFIKQFIYYSSNVSICKQYVSWTRMRTNFIRGFSSYENLRLIKKSIVSQKTK